MSKVIQVKNLYKDYGTQRVLDNLSLSIENGEFVTVMGPSGCGKSTLLYLIGGLDTQTDGEIIVLGTDMRTLSDSEMSKFRRQNIGFVFQFYNLIGNLTAEENILVPALMDGKKPKQLKERVDELLTLTGLSEKRKSFPSELSGGQQQRVAIARSLILNPQLLLADEPTGNLDRKNSEEVMKLFTSINSQYNTTILQVSHSSEMAQYSNRIINL